jgi:hypothetical protein
LVAGVKSSHFEKLGLLREVYANASNAVQAGAKVILKTLLISTPRRSVSGSSPRACDGVTKLSPSL